MKKNNLYMAIFLLGVFAVVSCTQDPIFFTISKEPAPIKPLIEGSPTNMVIFNRKYQDPNDANEKIDVPILYVASGKLHWYAKAKKGTGDSGWDSDEYNIQQPPGDKIFALAATENFLYALCLTGHGVDTALQRIGPESRGWETVKLDSTTSGYSLIQSIYTDSEGSRLFAGARRTDSDNCAILDLDESTRTLKLLKGEIKILSGAASDDENYYLCTRGSGIFQVAKSDNTVQQLDDKKTFMGIIKLEDEASTIIAVERNGGTFFQIDSDSCAPLNYSNGTAIKTDKFATGALTLWSNSAGKKMLIAAVQGSLYNTTTTSYTHGYVEFDLDTDGSLNRKSSRRDPGSLQSVSDNDSYKATIGKHPINYLLQLPEEIDEKKTFFASTQTAGLWSYKDRPENGGWQWNAEN